MPELEHGRHCKLTAFGTELKQQYQRIRFTTFPVGWTPLPQQKLRLQRNRTLVELETIFKPHRGKETKTRGEIIFIDGVQGSGKSTLMVHICQRWGKGELFQQFICVILVQLRDPAVQRAQTIADLLPYQDLIDAQELATELMATNGRGVLWILDGWDELPTHLLSLIHI